MKPAPSAKKAPHQDTRAAIIETATDLVQARGFDAFSYRDLAERIGIRAASIHYHFPAKEDLGVALIEEMARWGESLRADLESRHPTARERLLGLFEACGAASCGGANVCPLASLLASYGALPPRMQEALRRAQESTHARIARWLEEGRAQGGLRFPGSAFDQASLVQAVMQQGGQQARLSGGGRLSPLLAHLLATMAAA